MAVPPSTPVTTPVALTVAMVVDPELQVPPAVASDRVVTPPWQRVVAPVIVPAAGTGLMVTDEVTVVVPHALLTA